MQRAQDDDGSDLLDSVILELKRETAPQIPRYLLDTPIEVSEEIRSKISSPYARSLRRVAVAAVLVVAVGLGLTIFRSSPLLAQVQSAIKNAEVVSFDLETRHADSVIQRYHIQYSPQHGVRAESASKLHVFNASEELILEVDHASRAAKSRPVYDSEAMEKLLAGSIGELASLSRIEQIEAKRYSVDGKELIEFWAKWDSSVAHVSVDPETNLPLRIEVDRGHDGDGNKIVEVVTNIQFGTKASKRKFSLQVPDGYAFEEIKRTEPSEAVKNYVLSESGLGPIEWGMSFDEIASLIGRPDSFQANPAMVSELKDGKPVIVPGKGFKMVEAEPPHNIIQMHYDSLGFRVFVSEIEGVVSIWCYTGGVGQRRFPGKTAEGIEIGMTRDQVLSILDVSSVPMGRFQFRDDRLVAMGATGSPQKTMDE